MKRGGRAIAVVVLLAACAGLAACNASTKSSAIGNVTRLQGEGMLKRGASSSPLATDLSIQVDDNILTGAAARAELTFGDGTKLTVGEQSQVKINSFVFDETRSGNRLALDVAGPFRFVSGKLSKGAGSSVSVKTPVATIGVRGTDFWGGPIDGQYGVFLLEGSVSVTTAGGEAVLTAAGSGVNVVGAEQAPGAVTQWPQDKVDRAIATVTFQ